MGRLIKRHALDLIKLMFQHGTTLEIRGCWLLDYVHVHEGGGKDSPSWPYVGIAMTVAGSSLFTCMGIYIIVLDHVHSFSYCIHTCTCTCTLI